MFSKKNKINNFFCFLQTLLDNPKAPFEAYLGVGALAGHYCREHNCDGVPHFDQLLAKFAEVLGTNAKGSREKENHVSLVEFI